MSSTHPFKSNNLHDPNLRHLFLEDHRLKLVKDLNWEHTLDHKTPESVSHSDVDCYPINYASRMVKNVGSEPRSH